MPKNKLFLTIFLVLISCLYLYSRIQRIDAIPVFADEAIYIRWSQVIKNVETLRFIPLTDGKQPLFMWLTVPFFKLVSDPLFAGRLVSIMSGMFLVIGIFLVYSLLYYLNSKPKINPNPLFFIFESISYSFPSNTIPFVLYLTLPFSFFFDRLALADTLLSFLGCLALFLAILQSKYLRFDISLISGVVLGLAWITKSPAIYFIALYLFTVTSLSIFHKKFSFYCILYSLISIFIAFVIYTLLRLGPQFHMIASRNLDYIWPVTEIIRHPLDPLKPHLSDTFSIYKYFISLSLILVSALGWLLLFHKSNKALRIPLINLLILLSWWILPLVANASMAKVFTARYILFTLPPLIILLSFGIHYLISTRLIFILLVFFSLIPNIISIYNLSTVPSSISLPSTEKGYLADWTSGWGIKEAANYLKERSQQANVIVGSEGYFGTLPDGLQIYTDGTRQLTVVPSGIDITQIPSGLLNAKSYGDEVYLLFNQSRLKLTPDTYNQLIIVKKFNKPNNDALLLIKI